MMGGRRARWIGGPRAGLALAVALLAGAALAPVPARANDFDQFQNARAAYDSLNYELAAELFEGLLQDADLDEQRPLVVESHKYLGATYLFLGRQAEGEAQFARLLELEPQYVLDPLAFPAEVQRTFVAVKQRIEERRRRAAEEAARAAAEAEAARAHARAAQRQRLERLIELARTERVEQRRSRMIAMLPFGIGQFQNDDDGLGLVLAVSETALLATGVTTYFLHQAQPDFPKDLNEAQSFERIYRTSNQISMALFATVAIAGIVDAQLRFRETAVTDHKRDLPPDLETLSVGIGPGGVSLSGRF
ncbi:MAG: hypothetical protein PVI30_19005 [Myxococcales bacterium]